MVFKINHKKVISIIHKNNILAKVRRKKMKFNIGSTSVIAPNILEIDFTSKPPNTKWLTNITSLKFSNKNFIFICYYGLI